MSSATSSFGTLLKIGNGGTSETFATIAEVKDINGLELKLNTTEVTNHSSVDAWKEFIGTLLEMGPVTFKVNWLPADATHSVSAGLVKDLLAKTKRNFQLVYPSASPTTWPFTALVTKFKPAANVDGVLESDIELTPTGKATLP